jgi:hypothetical protein
MHSLKLKYIKKSTKNESENNLKDDKNLGIKILEMIIKHNLLIKYQEIDEGELEDRLN